MDEGSAGRICSNFKLQKAEYLLSKDTVDNQTVIRWFNKTIVPLLFFIDCWSPKLRPILGLLLCIVYCLFDTSKLSNRAMLIGNINYAWMHFSTKEPCKEAMNALLAWRQCHSVFRKKNRNSRCILPSILYCTGVFKLISQLDIMILFIVLPWDTRPLKSQISKVRLEVHKFYADFWCAQIFWREDLTWTLQGFKQIILLNSRGFTLLKFFLDPRTLRSYCI